MYIRMFSLYISTIRRYIAMRLERSHVHIYRLIVDTFILIFKTQFFLMLLLFSNRLMPYYANDSERLIELMNFVMIIP